MGTCAMETGLVMGEMEGVMEPSAVSWLLLALMVAWSSALVNGGPCFQLWD